MKTNSLDNLQERIAVVTGGGRGIGLVIVERLARCGAKVVIAERVDERGAAAAASLTAQGLLVTAIPLDVTDSASIQALVDRLLVDFGRIDILVNNAGMFIGHPAVDFPEPDWRLQLDVMLTGPFLCAKAIARAAMIPQRRGAIVNLSSIGGVGGWPLRHAYTTAKAGIVSLTRGLAVEWAQYNIRVNAVSPGPIRTEMLQEALDSGLSTLDRYLRRIPMGRIGEAGEVADAVVFLVSDRAAGVTGANLFVDGGWAATANADGIGYPEPEGE